MCDLSCVWAPLPASLFVGSAAHCSHVQHRLLGNFSPLCFLPLICACLPFAACCRACGLALWKLAARCASACFDLPHSLAGSTALSTMPGPLLYFLTHQRTVIFISTRSLPAPLQNPFLLERALLSAHHVAPAAAEHVYASCVSSSCSMLMPTMHSDFDIHLGRPALERVGTKHSGGGGGRQ